ncbi:MAG TPA: NAD(P)/FAD-dependent oxidoreductase [Bryobacteraceae bacterium]|nr:NAD(P)/FAD-dependent oxidoreductase [Bryobacteraceae bacterium]
MQFDVVIIGGGAAGLLCAAEAGRRGRSVALLEHAPEVGKKILISGGGRCNFTNIHCKPENFLSANPHFCKSALARYPPREFIRLLEKHRIAYYEKTLGQLFCERSARDIVRMLREECDASRVRIFESCAVTSVDRGTEFHVSTNSGEFVCRSLVIASGGLSIPKMGATAFGYRVAEQFGLKIRPCRPALVPLTFADPDRKRYCDLSGVSTEVIARVNGQQFREKMLITHRGMSGPAILQISSYWRPGEAILLDLLPGRDAAAELKQRKLAGDRGEIRSVIGGWIPKRIADRWFELQGPVKPILKTTDQELEAVAGKLHCWRLLPNGTEGYDKAEVTAGGVDTNELSSKTMESNRIPGLYFIGEVVDVTGHLGGFNFQWAWASGFCAGQFV